MALGPAKIELAFLNEADPQLEKVKFYYDTELGEIQSIRGKSPGAWLSYNTFLWSPAVRALTLLCVKCACGVPEEDKISGEEGSLASSLDYAVAKGTAWLSDMFGVNEEGRPYCRKLFLRSNPERKRPGPVFVSLNPQILRASNIGFLGVLNSEI